jgi:hypothetical protein
VGAYGLTPLAPPLLLATPAAALSIKAQPGLNYIFRIHPRLRARPSAEAGNVFLIYDENLEYGLNMNRLLPKSLFALSKTFFDKSKARSRRFQNSPFGLKQLKSLIFRFAKIY